MKKTKSKTKDTPVTSETAKTETRALSDLNQVWLFAQRNWIFIAILCALVVIVYANALGNGLISDDTGLQSEGDNILSFKFIFLDHGGPLGFLRYLVYAISYALGGVNPMLFRLGNVIFHLGNVLLVFLLVTLVSKKRLAFFAACLFAVHPILVETVTWISGGGYAQYTFFFLLSLVMYILSSRSKNQIYYYTAIGFFALSLFSFNRAMTLSPIFLLYEFCFGDWKRNWKKTLPFFGLSAVWALYYFFQVGGRQQSVVQTANVTNFVYNPLFQIPFAISSYFELSLWPDRLSFYHSDIDVPQGEMVIRWVVLLTFLGATTWGFFKNKQVFFWSLFFIFGLFLYLIPVELAWVVAERYVYVGSIGIFVLLGLIFHWFFKFKKARIGIYVIFFLIIGLFGVRTIVRNFDWKNEESLMRATLRTNPENAKVHNILASEMIKRKDFDGAKKEIDEALKLDPELADIYMTLGNYYAGIKQPDEAVKYFSKLLENNPQNWQIYQQIANMYYDLQDYNKAAEYTVKTIEINPHPALYTNLGVLYSQSGQIEKAKEAFTQALKLDPTNSFAQQSLNQLNNPISPTPTVTSTPTPKR